MGHKKLTVEGLNVAFRNMPGSAITWVSIDGKDAFGFDPESAAFVQFLNGKQTHVTPDLPDVQALALRQALSKHSEERRLEFAQWRTKDGTL